MSTLQFVWNKYTGKHRQWQPHGDQEGPYPKYKTIEYKYDTEVNCGNRLLLGLSLAVVGSFVLVGGYQFRKALKMGLKDSDVLDNISTPLMKSLLISVIVCPIVTTFPCWFENMFIRNHPK